MPYIEEIPIRRKLDELIFSFLGLGKESITGKLNYFICKLAWYTCRNYEDYRNFIGEIEAAKLEIYRKQIAPYEDTKIEENGDIDITNGDIPESC